MPTQYLPVRIIPDGCSSPAFVRAAQDTKPYYRTALQTGPTGSRRAALRFKFIK